MSLHDHPYGVGIAYRYHLHEEVLHYASEIDLLEIPTEDHIIRRRALSYPQAKEKFDRVRGEFPCVGHGISLSIGSLEPLDRHYVGATKKFIEETGINTFSEHLAFHRMDGKDVSTFLGMPLDDVSLDWLVSNYNQARDQLGRDFALENVSLSFRVPGGKYSEAEFLAEFLRRTTATLLLDVTNLYNNCTNYDLDPVEYLHTLPGDRVSQLHLAGGHFENDFLIDSHSYPVMNEVWDLYEKTLEHTSADIVIVERDYMCFPFREVMDDIRRARELFYRVRPERPATESRTATAPTSATNGNGESPNFLAPRFKQLRGFQRALLRAITDDEFRDRNERDATEAAEQFELDDDWLSRFRGCEKLDELADAWKQIEQLNAEDEERFRRWEWSQWASQEQTDTSTV